MDGWIKIDKIGRQTGGRTEGQRDGWMFGWAGG
jgi:hypothetical protein